jgi:hypothetical protein
MPTLTPLISKKRGWLHCRDLEKPETMLFEHNRIHNNSIGMFFESTWDLGSVILIIFL